MVQYRMSVATESHMSIHFHLLQTKLLSFLRILKRITGLLFCREFLVETHKIYEYTD